MKSGSAALGTYGLLAFLAALTTNHNVRAESPAPDFDCGREHGAIPELICASPDLSRLDLQFVQTYYALRQQVGPYAQERLKADDLAFQRSIVAQCAPDGTEQATAAQCVAEAFKRQRDIWRNMLAGPAAEEAARPLEDHLAIQARLRELGFLPASAPTDGIYGTATRMAIATWQRLNGRADTGFIADSEVKMLMAAPSPPAVLSANQQSRPDIETNTNSAQPAASTQPAASGQEIPFGTGNATSNDVERRFIATIDDYAERYRNAPNEMIAGALRPARAAALCDLMGGSPVTAWVGTIETLSSNNEGEGVLGIRISDAITISTWDNSFSDAGDATLIPLTSPLFAKVSEMSVGDHVRFDANLVSNHDDCFRETSITFSGGMENPDFIAKFTDVSRVN